jgi:glycine/D-amino acid oxidase-like deaminating enzyme
MKFLISTNVQIFRSVLGNDCSCICFCHHNAELSQHINGRDPVDVWICEGEEVTEELLEQWLSRDRGLPKSLLVNDIKLISNLESFSRGRLFQIQALPRYEQLESSRVVSILRAGERLYARGYAQSVLRHGDITTNRGTKRSVLIVGAGIMNLVAAESLAIRGFQVRIVDANPDPRTCEDWTRLGATHGGGDARMFTFTEADNYNEKGSDIYHNMRHIFRNTTLNGGWSVRSPLDLSAAETAWINTLEQVPAWLAQAMKEDIYYVNQEAGKLWSDFMARAPDLFSKVSLHPNILRLYAENTVLTAAQSLNEDIGALIDEFPLPELLRENPGFYPAVKSNDLAGAFIVRGFTLGIHSFVNKLIDRITDLGGDFTWNCSVLGMQRNASGQVTLLESQQGELQADNYVMSTGVTRNGLLNGTTSENLVNGVLGVWLQIPDLNPRLRKSIKIHRRGCLVEDINVTVSRDVRTNEEILILGGGYGYVGLDFPTPESPEMEALFNELEVVAGIYFPTNYRCAKERGTLWPNGERKYCIRPFTCTGLGIFEDIPTTQGGHLIITGGNNTGGFAQAPAIARAICRAMDGEHDPIHEVFHPCRSKLVAS